MLGDLLVLVIIAGIVVIVDKVVTKWGKEE